VQPQLPEQHFENLQSNAFQGLHTSKYLVVFCFNGFFQMDWPGCRYWRELVDQFPEAKVILTIRDFDSWYKSARTTIYNYDKRLEQKHRRFPWLRILRPRDFAWNQLAEILWGEHGNFKGQFEDKEKARSIFQKHIEEVMLVVVTSLDKVTIWVLGTSSSNAH
jgi:hypothetical protein